MMWKLRTSAIAILTIVACGDDGKSATDDKGSDTGSNGGDFDGGEGDVTCKSLANMPELPNADIAYPDSVCEGDACQEGGCDPLGRCSPTCNAWRVVGQVAFHSAPMSDKLDLGFPAVPARGDDDICSGTGFMQSADADVNCCQRADNLTAKLPMLKLTGLKMMRPLTFALSVVEGTNKQAIEFDLYNSVLGLSSVEDGALEVTMGSALPNRDGSFFPMNGPFTSGGTEFNSEGAWDAQLGLPGTLSTTKEGRLLQAGPSRADQDLVLVLWFDNKLDFSRLALPLRGVEYELPITEDLSCVGARTPAGSFELMGKLNAYLPVEGARNTSLYVTRTEAGASNLCTFTSSATECGKDVSKWRK